MYAPIVDALPAGSVRETYFLYTDNPPYESLEAYAEQMIRKQNLADAYDVVVGTSMGGMIAQIALTRKWIRTKKLVLISTAFSSEDLTLFSWITGRMFQACPLFLVSFFIFLFSLLYPFLRSSMKYKRLFSQMMRRVPPGFLRGGIRMILNWSGVPVQSVKTVSFHGTSDPLISFRRIAEKRVPDYPLLRGNHIVFTQVGEVIAAEILKAE